MRYILIREPDGQTEWFNTRQAAEVRQITRMMLYPDEINRLRVIPAEEWENLRGSWGELSTFRQPESFRKWLERELNAAGLRENFLFTNNQGGFITRALALYAVRLKPRGAIVHIRDSSKRKAGDYLRHSKTYCLLENGHKPIVLPAATVRSAINHGKDPFDAVMRKVVLK